MKSEGDVAHWLIKSEPSAYSWDQLVKEKRTSWTGVRNPQASANLSSMKVGDRCFFYHSGEGKEIVGIAEIIREHYPDPTAKPGEPWVAVDVKAVEPMPRPVTLAAAQAEPGLKDMVLVNNSRLSVQPVSDSEWKAILALTGTAKP